MLPSRYDSDFTELALALALPTQIGSWLECRRPHNLSAASACHTALTKAPS
jgi:hypothetical protein